MSKPRYRLAVDCPLAPNARVSLHEHAAHYLTGVLRLTVGAQLLLFTKAEGEWLATIAEIRKKEVVLVVGECTRPPVAPLGLMVCFAPIKGGRMETIIEKATELGASVLQPVITARTIVDKVNVARADSIAREAAEQCERMDWPEIREPVKLPKLLGEWPADMPLIYGDERGASASVVMLQKPSPLAGEGGAHVVGGKGGVAAERLTSLPPHPNPPPQGGREQWAILAGPEGGFTPDEFAALARVKMACGVSVGPRILRADTAVITLCVATLMAWGDWSERPRFVSQQ